MVKPVELSLDTSDATITGKKMKKKRAKAGGRTMYSSNKVAPEEPETSAKSSKINGFNPHGQSQIPGAEVKFDTYSPPLGSYDFYKCYDEYLALLDEYKAEGSTEKYDALKHVWQQKMELELLNRFPWPPKLARNTFWTFGYYRDYYPTEEHIKTTLTQNLRPSLMTLFLGDAGAESDAYSKAPANYNSHPTHKKQTTDYMDSTVISTAAVAPLEDLSIMDGYAHLNEDSVRKKHSKDESMNTFNTKTQESVQYIVIPSDDTLLEEEDRKKKNKKKKGRRSVAFTYDYLTDASEDQTIDSIGKPKKKKKKKLKKKRTKTIYETTTYGENGSVISTEITEEINK